MQLPIPGEGQIHLRALHLLPPSEMAAKGGRWNTGALDETDRPYEDATNDWRGRVVKTSEKQRFPSKSLCFFYTTHAVSLSCTKVGELKEGQNVQLENNVVHDSVIPEPCSWLDHHGCNMLCVCRFEGMTFLHLIRLQKADLLMIL